MADKLSRFLVQVEGLDLEHNRAGSGAYGVVFKVTVDGRECIAKKLHNILLKAGEYYPVDQRDSIIKKFRNECSILSDLSHPNIVSFVGVHYGRDKNDISLIMERLHTDLAAFVYSQPKTSKAQRIHILWDVSKGLDYLHSLVPPLIHRDLTAPNVLLTEDLTAKIGDLGVSRYVDPDAGTQVLSKAPGNVYYMPPETREDDPVYTVKLDIFSFGTLIMHTFIGKVPDLRDVPYNERAIQLSREGKIELTRRRKAIDQMGEDHCIHPIIVRCLHDNPDPRPTAGEVCELLRELCLKYPTVGFQRSEIKTALTQPLREGDTWFLVSMCWVKKWKEYVNWDESSTDEDSANPGPVDNSPLLTDGNLLEGLKKNDDYYLLPETAWGKLSSWYGLSTGSKVIPRKVVQGGDDLMVEVYLIQFKLCVYPNLNDVRRRALSRADTVVNLERVMREEFEVPSSVECRVWCRYKTHTYELLSRADQTLQNTGLIDRQDTVIVLEKNTDGTWPQETSPAAQRIQIESDLRQKLNKGDNWYVVDSHWMRQWREYVRHVSSDDSAHPGPVNNASLFNGSKLRKSMLEKLDYYLLPESAWEKVCFWYGLSTGSKVISRTVIECDPLTNECEVEVYPLVLNLCDQSEVKKREFSRADTVAMVKAAAVSMECDHQMWYNSDNGVVILSKLDQTLLEVGLHNGQTILFDIPEREVMDTAKNVEPMETWQQMLDIIEPLTDKWYELGILLEVDTSFLHWLEKKPKEERLKEVALKVWNSGRDKKFIVDKMRDLNKEVAEKLMDVMQETGVVNEKEQVIEVQRIGSQDNITREANNTESEATPPTESATPPPDIDTQKKEIQAALRQQLKKGDIWYLVDIVWMKQWKKYVGYDTWDQSDAGKESADPGPLDNSTLFSGESLRDHLMDELDYYLLPESAWNKLSSWYGLSTGSKVISRRVVEYGLYMKHCKVEVYLLELKMCVHPHLNDTKKREFSRADTVADLERVMREEFEVPSSVECRVWHRYISNTYELLSRYDQTLRDAGLYSGQVSSGCYTIIVLEKKNEDGLWPRTTSTVSSTNHSTHSSDDFSSSNSTRSVGSGYSYEADVSSPSFVQPSRAGSTRGRLHRPGKKK